MHLFSNVYYICCTHVVVLLVLGSDYNMLLYWFFSDRLIELSVGGTNVADIFKLHGESYFRDYEVSQEAMQLIFSSNIIF